ncbi:MAG: phosphohydrolase [Magnetococcales bacterium]|nr:phosphohydrolase [Magnetococcales bacterium]
MSHPKQQPEKRSGAWIQTYTGRQFWPMDARPTEIDLLDIAHALSMLCRFNGHCQRFYSVAEHSVHVSQVVAPEHARWGLLHDAAEAYLSDLPQPIKRELRAFSVFEEQLQRVIAQRFALPVEMPPAVKQADMVLLATEKAALMTREPVPWDPLPPALDPAMIRSWSPEQAKQAFLERFDQLFNQPG